MAYQCHSVNVKNTTHSEILGPYEGEVEDGDVAMGSGVV